jgi:uncharacterized membrane protein YhaH (DUF805 family)
MGALQFLFSFNGRFRRLHYWLCQLLQPLIMIGLVMAVVGTTEASGIHRVEDTPVGQAFLFVAIVVYFVMSLACHVKRWHDLGRSGWWQLVSLIPFGGIYVLIMCGFIRGDDGPNKYGPDPLEKAAPQSAGA